MIEKYNFCVAFGPIYNSCDICLRNFCYVDLFAANGLQYSYMFFIIWSLCEVSTILQTNRNLWMLSA